MRSRRGILKGIEAQFALIVEGHQLAIDRCTKSDRIHDVTGSFDHIGIGSDLDGYIQPALPGLEHMGHMRAFQEALERRYGTDDAAKMCSGNALRVLR